MPELNSETNPGQRQKARARVPTVCLAWHIHISPILFSQQSCKEDIVIPCHRRRNGGSEEWYDSLKVTLLVSGVNVAKALIMHTHTHTQNLHSPKIMTKRTLKGQQKCTQSCILGILHRAKKVGKREQPKPGLPHPALYNLTLGFKMYHWVSKLGSLSDAVASSSGERGEVRGSSSRTQPCMANLRHGVAIQTLPEVATLLESKLRGPSVTGQENVNFLFFSKS